MYRQKLRKKSLPSTSQGASASHSTFPAINVEDPLPEEYLPLLCCAVPRCNEKTIAKLLFPPSYVFVYYGLRRKGMLKFCIDCIKRARESILRDKPNPTNHSIGLEDLFQSINQILDESNRNDNTPLPNLDHEETCVDEKIEVNDNGTKGESINRHEHYEVVDAQEKVEHDELDLVGNLPSQSSLGLNEPMLRVLKSSYHQSAQTLADFASNQEYSTSSSLQNSYLQSETSHAKAVSMFLQMVTELSPKVADVIYAINDRPMKCWLIGEVMLQKKNPITRELEFVVMYEPTSSCGMPLRRTGKMKSPPMQFERRLTTAQMAFIEPSQYPLPIGTRVIAKFSNNFYTYKKFDGEFYSGIVGEVLKPHTKDRYLIFFDDGSAQYVKEKDVLKTYKNTGLPLRHLHPEHFDFLQMYLKKDSQWPLAHLPLGGLVSAEWNGMWMVTRVLEQDGSLAKLHFENYERIEWVYLGSGRIRTIYNHSEQEVALKLDDPLQLLEYQGSIKKLNLPSNIPRPKEYTFHHCYSGCAIKTSSVENFKLMSPLAIPLFFGWDRKEKQDCEPFYVTPCGLKLYRYADLKMYLTITKSNLTLDLFCFDSRISVLDEFVPARVLWKKDDISEGKEARPVQAINSIDHEQLPQFEYITESVVAANSKVTIDKAYNRACCKCTENCPNQEHCSCRSPNTNVSYQNKRLMTAVLGGVFECNWNCKCDETCPNRLVQCGMKWPLQLFKTAKKGWALRALHDIPKGAFICTYPGEILSDVEADEIGKIYGVYFVTLSYAVPEESKGKCAENVRESTSPAHLEMGLTIDARMKGSVGRFISHSCDPNVFLQRVHFNTKESQFPHIAFFAVCPIKAGSELTFDYKYKIEDCNKNAVHCECQTPACRKRLL